MKTESDTENFLYQNLSIQRIADLSNQEQFIGRGERLVKQLLENPFGIRDIRTQVPISRLISFEEFQFFDDEIKKHKFDFVLYRHFDIIAVEVNYQHGEKADRKSNRIFEPALKNNNVTLLRIDDYECDYLFKENTHGNHKKTTNDLRDILNAFDNSGISL